MVWLRSTENPGVGGAEPPRPPAADKILEVTEDILPADDRGCAALKSRFDPSMKVFEQ